MQAFRAAYSSKSGFRLKATFWLDATLLISFCALETVPFTGLVLHEWLGLALVGILVVNPMKKPAATRIAPVSSKPNHSNWSIRCNDTRLILCRLF